MQAGQAGRVPGTSVNTMLHSSWTIYQSFKCHPNVSEFIFLKTQLATIPEEITILFLTKVCKFLTRLLHLNPSDH